MPIYTIIATLLLYPLYTWITLSVGMSRSKHNVPAPQMEGSPEFMRTLRVQLNTVERLVIFLPLLWVAGIYGNDLFAGICGFAWVLGRVLYALGYYRSELGRRNGFMINSFAEAALFLGIIYYLIF